MKKICILLIILIFISNTALADDAIESLTLDDVIELALENSDELEAMQKLYQENKRDLEIYQNNFAQDININLASNYNLWEEDDKALFTNGVNREETKLKITKNFSVDSNLTLSQSLLKKDDDNNLEFAGRGGNLTYSYYILRDYKVENDYKQGLMDKELEILKAEEEIKNLKDQLKSQIIDKYYNLVVLEQEIEVKEELLEKSKVILKVVKARVEAGQNLELDRQETELQVEENKLDLSHLNSQYRLALRDLAMRLEVELAENLKFVDSKKLLPFNNSAAEVKRIVYRNSLEVDILKLKIRQERDLLRELDDNQDFSLKLVSGAAWEKNNNDKYDSDYRVGVRLDYNFNNYQKKEENQKIKESQIKLDSLAKQLEDIRDEVVFEVDNAFLRLEDYQAKLTLYNKAIVNLAEKLKIADYKYKAGLITVSELLSQQLDLTQKRIEYIKNLVAYNKQIYEIQRIENRE